MNRRQKKKLMKRGGCSTYRKYQMYLDLRKIIEDGLKACGVPKEFFGF